MKRCSKCNLIMGDGAKTCSNCEQSLEKDFTYIYNNCGQVNFNKAIKCSRCGMPTIFAKQEHQNLTLEKEKTTEFAESVKDPSNNISIEEYKNKTSKIINSLKEKAANVPIEEYTQKAGQVYNSAKDMTKDIPVDKYKDKATQAYDSAKNIVKDISVNEYKVKANKTFNSLKENATKITSRNSDKEINNVASDENKKSFFDRYKQFICGVVAAITLFAFYQFGVHSTTKKDVENTTEKTITAVNPSSKAVNLNKPSKSIIDKSAEGKAYTERLLKKYGINRQVLATSYGNNSAGFVALLYDGSEQHIAIIDKRNDRLGIANLSESLLDMENNEHGLVEVNIIILNDTKDNDKDSGIWQGAHHLLPIHVQYKRKNDGKIEPGMIKTCYRDSMKDDQYLQESKNVDIVNLLLTEMPVMMKNYIEKAQKRK